MKSLKEFSMNLSEKDYHAYPAWSHSLITRYLREGFSSIATIHEPKKPTPAMEFGSLFDSILTRGKETLEDYVVDETVAPPAEKSVYDWLLDRGYTQPLSEISENDLMCAMDACRFYMNLKPGTRLEKLTKSCQYYDVRCSGKKIVSRDDWNDAVEMARAFRSNDYLNKLFGVKNTDKVEYIYQAQFLVTLPVEGGNPVKFKIMPDLLKVDHENKTIQPVDLKTSEQPAYDFKESFLRFRYDIQASSYTDVLQMIILKDDVYKDYTILPYLFTDISRTDKRPITYVYDPHSPSQENGLTYTSNGKEYKYKHWTSVLSEMVEYEEEHAVVPAGISVEGPNDIMSLINRE